MGGCRNLGNTLAAEAVAFRLGPMQWSPMAVSRFKQGISPTIGTMQGVMVSRVVRRRGPKRSFERGALVSAIGFFGWSQVWRPAALGRAGWWTAFSLCEDDPLTPCCHSSPAYAARLLSWSRLSCYMNVQWL